MSRPSSIDQLPDEIRSEIGRLMTQGATIDRIVEHLRTLVGGGSAPSRSAVGRHVRKMAKVGERLQRSRTVAEALVRELGDAEVSKTTRLNIELLHGAIFDLFNAGDEDELNLPDEAGRAALAGNPEGLKFLAQAIENLTRASKTDVEFVSRIEARAAERAKKEAAAAVEVVAKREGISKGTLGLLKAEIFGVRA